jgi:hypothetical protein
MRFVYLHVIVFVSVCLLFLKPPHLCWYDFALSIILFPLLNADSHLFPFFLGMVHVPQQWLAPHTTLTTLMVSKVCCAYTLSLQVNGNSLTLDSVSWHHDNVLLVDLTHRTGICCHQ